MNVIDFNIIEHDVVRKPVPTFRRHALAGFVVLATAWSGVSAHAADDDADNALGSFFKTMGLKTKVGPTPAFVAATHPDPSTLKFIPTGTPHPKRDLAVKSAAAVEAAKASLDAARTAQLQPKSEAKPAVRKPKALKASQASVGN